VLKVLSGLDIFPRGTKKKLNFVDQCYSFSSLIRRTHHATRHITPIHNILSTVPQLNISKKALGTLPENDNVMPKHVEDAIHN
jgi:hypothetical protein